MSSTKSTILVLRHFIALRSSASWIVSRFVQLIVKYTEKTLRFPSQVLLKAGADVKAVDKYQVTARHYCFQQEGRALLDGVPILNEVDGAVSSKKSRKKSSKNKIDEAPRKPKESIKRLQKSISKKESKKVSSSGGGVCSKFM